MNVPYSPSPTLTYSHRREDHPLGSRQVTLESTSPTSVRRAEEQSLNSQLAIHNRLIAGIVVVLADAVGEPYGLLRGIDCQDQVRPVVSRIPDAVGDSPGSSP